MPKLVCTTCCREIYTVAPLKALFTEERKCGRCGAELIADRRGVASASPGAGAKVTTPAAGPPAGVPDRRSSSRS